MMLINPYRFASGIGGIDANTILMLHMDGADGSTSFVDSSANATTIIANGNGQIDTAQSKFGGASYLGDGSGDYLSCTTASAPGTGPLTIDFWVRFAATGGILFNSRSGDTNDGLALTDDLRLTRKGTVILSGGWSYSLNTWYHVAIVREGTGSNQTKSYVNGTLFQSGTANNDCSNTAIQICGSSHAPVGSLNGWLDEFRYSNIARWTADFTPPGSPYSLV